MLGTKHVFLPHEFPMVLTKHSNSLRKLKERKNLSKHEQTVLEVRFGSYKLQGVSRAARDVEARMFVRGEQCDFCTWLSQETSDKKKQAKKPGAKALSGYFRSKHHGK